MKTIIIVVIITTHLRFGKCSNAAEIFQFNITEFDVIFVAFTFSGGLGITVDIYRMKVGTGERENENKNKLGFQSICNVKFFDFKCLIQHF